LYSVIIVVCSGIHLKHKHTLWTECRISECYAWWAPCLKSMRM